MFPLKNFHLLTRISPDWETSNQLEHVIIRIRYMSVIIDAHKCRLWLRPHYDYTDLKVHYY
jgi:hypothetical protein